MNGLGYSILRTDWEIEEEYAVKKHIKWQDRSYELKTGGWVPEAVIYIIEEGRMISQQVILPNSEYEKIEQGRLIFATSEQ
jgi:hypothetical protein